MKQPSLPLNEINSFYQEIRRNKYFPLFILVFLLLIFIASTISYQSKQHNQIVMLLFPKADTSYQNGEFSHLSLEKRFIPKPQSLLKGSSYEERLLYYSLKEIIYGPMENIRSYPFLPIGSKLQRVIKDGSRVYIDFNSALLAGAPEFALEPNERLELIAKSLKMNFPEISQITFTIDGTEKAQIQV